MKRWEPKFSPEGQEHLKNLRKRTEHLLRNPNLPSPKRFEPSKKKPGDKIITSSGTFIVGPDGDPRKQ